MLTAIAADLAAWTRLLDCTGEAKVLASCEPKALRYRFLHVPARLTHSARRRRLRIPESNQSAAITITPPTYPLTHPHERPALALG